MTVPGSRRPAGGWIVREAADADIGAITGLFNAQLATTTTEYTDVAHTTAGRRAWLTSRRAAAFPVLVAASDESGRVIGVASYGDFCDSVARPGYRYTVEHTVHVDQEWWGTGVGRSLMVALIDRARADGMHVMVGAVDAENVGSLRFHERLGFVEVARLPEVGHKFGRWLHLVLVQLRLDDRPTPPAGGDIGR